MASNEQPSSAVEELEGLPEQDLAQLDVDTLTPITPYVMQRQATINIGTIGHVAHGKSTVVKAISGVQTVRFKTEIVRNITIKLGYANAKIYKCDNPECPRPGCYRSYRSSQEARPLCERPGCNSRMTLQRHVSFVDCFGLDTSFATPTGEPLRNEDLKLGDVLLGPDGQPRTVLSIKEGQKPLYEVAYQSTQSRSAEAEKFTCTGGHLLCLRIDTPVDTPVFDRANNVYSVKCFVADEDSIRSTKTVFPTLEQAQQYYDALDKSPVEFEMTVESYLVAPKSVRAKARLFRASALDFGKPAMDLSIGNATEEDVAWLTGLWLGRGDARDASFAVSSEGDDEVLDRVTKIAKKMGLAATVRYSADRSARVVSLPAENLFWKKLEALNLAGNKRVPEALQRHSLAVRHALVAGLVDASGSYSSGQFELEFSAEADSKLFHSAAWTLRSMGLAVHLSGPAAEKLRMRFSGPSAAQLPLASPLKAGRHLVGGSAASHQFAVKPIGVAPFRGFEVDGDGRILLSDFVVAHNCPGHDILMATMLNGAAVMDAALLLVAGNEPCPQPQTSEHLAAVEIMKLKNIIILQNKIDLVQPKDAASQYEQILNFVRHTVAEASPIIPISAQLKYNIDVVCEYICTKVPIPLRDFTSSPRLIIIRSFDVNRPGSTADDLAGGVAGGSILRGVLKLGDQIEVRPGIVTKDSEGRVQCVPILSQITSLYAENNTLKFAVPGGLIGVGTKIDPTLTRADRLVGQVLGHVNTLPEVFTELEISFFLLLRLLGVKQDAGVKSGNKVKKLAKGEILLVNIGSTSTGARILNVKGDLAKLALTSPVCTSEGEKLALSRRVDKHWRLIGWGKIRRGIKIGSKASVSVSMEEDGAQDEE